jgi:hypothetical protein
VPDSSVTLTVSGLTLSASDMALVSSVDVLEAMYAQTQVSVVVTCDVDNTGEWSTPLDSLVAPFAPFQIEIDRDGQSLIVPARATSASWSLQPGSLSTLTIAGLDASADLDQVEQNRSWAGVSDADIARTLLGPVATPQTGQTPLPDGADRFTAHQRGTDWSFLRALAQRNDFDVYLTVGDQGVLTGVFDKIDPNGPEQATLDLGYGSLGGVATVQVQLAASQHVLFCYGVEGEGDQQVAENDGTGNAMGAQSLGGATTVLRDSNDLPGVQSPDVAAQALAERSAFCATLSVSLTGPAMPLLRARQTAVVTGLGTVLSGKWLVQSVRHTITQGGHVQALTLTRNALGAASAGPDAAAEAGVAALAGAL